MITSEDAFVDEVEDDLNNFEEENNADEAEEAAPEAEDANKKPVKPKRVVRNPQPKLNEQTLKGPRGVTALPSYFDRVKYKGKGYEEQDLSVILKTYEYWCHRLFPKYPFDDCIAKIEKLGSKRAVVTHIKKIRLNMIDEDQPIVSNEFVESEPEDNDDNLFGNVDIPAPVEITEEQQEQIRLNKERAENLRRERLNKAKELSESLLQEPGGSQLENFTQNLSPDDSHDEDVDSIFDKIREFNNEEDIDTNTMINDKPTPSVEESCEPENIESLTIQSVRSSLLDSDSVSSQSKTPSEITATNEDKDSQN